MVKIIGIENDEILIGQDNKEILAVSSDKLNFISPVIGESVEVYGNGDDIIVSRA
ncbi:hypothetical protein RyT2_24590 [Pseudolactococcus yaeyamensis]